uniref:Uncharacterized protein n=1 Tax=Rhizophora mucronata TaxID=61149 RepID=A0A2P2QUW3_RHIMU
MNKEKARTTSLNSMLSFRKAKSWIQEHSKEQVLLIRC